MTREGAHVNLQLIPISMPNIKSGPSAVILESIEELKMCFKAESVVSCRGTGKSTMGEGGTSTRQSSKGPVAPLSKWPICRQPDACCDPKNALISRWAWNRHTLSCQGRRFSALLGRPVAGKQGRVGLPPPRSGERSGSEPGKGCMIVRHQLSSA